MQFQKLELDPAANPAVLDTATWDRGAAAKALTAMPTVTLQSLGSALWAEGALSGPAGITLYSPSRAIHEDCAYGLASLGDGQQVFLCGGRADASPLGEPFAVLELPSGGSIAAYPTDAPIIHRYLRAGSQVGDRHADDHCRVARHLDRHGALRLCGQRHPELGARAASPAQPASRRAA